MRPASRALPHAGVAELVDALDLGSSAARRESSSLFPRTTTPGLLLLQQPGCFLHDELRP